MTQAFPILLAIHIACGLAAVAVGLLPVLTRKGGRLHRLSGRVFAGFMAVLLAAAWAMTAIHFSAYFLALSATASLTLFSGLRVLRRKRLDLRREDRATLIDWVATLAVVGVGGFTLWLVFAERAENPAVSSALAFAGLTYGGWDLWRFARPADWPFSPQLWTYEHLVKMLGAYGAVLAAFSGNFLTFIPAPWSQLWPSLLFQTLSVLWIVRLSLGRRGEPAPA